MSLSNAERLERLEQYLADLADIGITGSQRTATATAKYQEIVKELRPVEPVAEASAPVDLCGKTHSDTRMEGWACVLPKGHRGGHQFQAPKEEEEPVPQSA